MRNTTIRHAKYLLPCSLALVERHIQARSARLGLQRTVCGSYWDDVGLAKANRGDLIRPGREVHELPVEVLPTRQRYRRATGQHCYGVEGPAAA